MVIRVTEHEGFHLPEPMVRIDVQGKPGTSMYCATISKADANDAELLSHALRALADKLTEKL